MPSVVLSPRRRPALNAEDTKRDEASPERKSGEEKRKKEKSGTDTRGRGDGRGRGAAPPDDPVCIFSQDFEQV